MSSRNTKDMRTVLRIAIGTLRKATTLLRVSARSRVIENHLGGSLCPTLIRGYAATAVASSRNPAALTRSCAQTAKNPGSQGSLRTALCSEVL